MPPESPGIVLRPSPVTVQPTCGNKKHPSSARGPCQLLTSSAAIVILGHVALANVIRLKHASAISHNSHNNTYQFSLHTDSDMMAASCSTKAAGSPSSWTAECLPVLVGKSNPPPPGHCRAGMKKEASNSPSPGRVVGPSPVLAPRPTYRAMRIPVASITASAEHDYPSAPTCHGVRPSECPAPGRGSIIPTGNSGLVALTIWTLLGSIAVCPLAATSRLTLCPLLGLLHPGLAVTANHFTLRNGYGTVEARYHLTAYNCSDPTEVQAYSSIPASPCHV